LDMPTHHVAHGHNPGPAVGCILLALDGPIRGKLGVEHLAQDIQPANQGTLETERVGAQAAVVNAALGNDHVVWPGVDEADGTVILCLLERSLGVAGEVPDLFDPRAARGGNLDAAHLRSKRPLLPASRIEINLMAGADEAAAKVNDIRLGSAARGV